MNNIAYAMRMELSDVIHETKCYISQALPSHLFVVAALQNKTEQDFDIYLSTDTENSN